MSECRSPRNVVEHVTPEAFEPTVDKLVSAIKAAGLVVIARLDHAAGAQTVGLDLPPTLVIVYGHPSGGTPVMQAHPTAALDLPLRVLVRSEGVDVTVVSYHPVVEMLAAHGVPGDMARRLAPAQALIARALARE
jgi:uncharacterized protein (DUF302 family)